MNENTEFNSVHRRFVIAPMMELTDRHYRYLARLLTRHALLYTEMLTSKAVIHGDREYLLGKHEVETPVVLQLGGSDEQEMASAAAIGEQWGYQEINMNVGCPSDRVKAGRFGACLMAEPELVRDIVGSMQAAVNIPVTVKCRLGIDRDDSYEALSSFTEYVVQSGCRHLIVHARKAWLDGLSPKENRTIPPLRYNYVYRLKQEFPDLHITVNGGIETLDACVQHLEQVDGVMLGRAAYYNPAMLAQVDLRIFSDVSSGSSAHLPGESPGDVTANNAVALSNHLTGGESCACDQDISLELLSDVARSYAQYMQHWVDKGVRLSAMSRHLVALFQQVPGARLWRRHISEHAGRSTDAIALVDGALDHVLTEARRSA